MPVVLDISEPAGNCRAVTLRRLPLRACLSALLACASLALQAQSPPPAWWAATGAFNGLPSNPNATVTVGQLEAVLAAADQKLNADFGAVGGAGTAIDSLPAYLQDNADLPGLDAEYFPTTDLSGPGTDFGPEVVNLNGSNTYGWWSDGSSFSARFTAAFIPALPLASWHPNGGNHFAVAAWVEHP
jgi:hypothetical protein